MAEALIGQKLNNGEYVLREVLGRGGMATVYRAYAKGLDTDVAIKVLAPHLAADQGFRERFHDEARNLSHLHHPNLVEVYYYGEERDLVYIVMRLVGGGTLKDRIRALDHPLGAVEAARIILQVADALQHAHEQGLVHLDIKPANILLGRADWPLLSDFGITRAVGRQKTESGRERVAGTPLYMSPEQWQGGPLDGRSDEYSLAITAYEILSGQCPFTAHTTEELFEQHTRSLPPAPRHFNPGIPNPVESVLLKGLAKEPDDRYPTVGDFGRALSDAVERTRGVSLETKAALAHLAPNLLAAFALTLAGPIVASMLPPTRIFGGQIPLAWPFQFVAALLLSLALLGMRWPLLGLLSRSLNGLLAGQRASSRKPVLGSLETIVSLLYLGIFYHLLAIPLLGLSREALPGSLAQALAITMTLVVVLLALRLAARAQQTVGSLLAGLVVAVTLTSLAALPAADLGAPANFRLIGNVEGLLAILSLVLLVAVRQPFQKAVADLVGPLVGNLYSAANPTATPADLAMQRRRAAPVIGSLVDLVLLLIGDLLLRQPSLDALRPLGNLWLGPILLTALALLIWLLLALRLRALAGTAGLAAAVLLGAPLLTNLPVLDPSLLHQTWPAVVVSWLVATALTLLIIALRRPVQSFGRRALAASVDRGLLGTQIAPSEDLADQRLAAAGQLVDAIFDVGLLVLGYWILGVPVAAALAERSGDTWLPSVFLVGLLLLCGVIVYFRWQAARAIFSRSGGEAWSRKARVLSFASVILVALAAGGCAATPAALAMPEDVGGYQFAPVVSQSQSAPALVVAWEQWIPRSPSSDEATYRIALSCSDGQQFGDFRQAISLHTSQPVPVGLVTVPTSSGLDCTRWREVYWARRHRLDISDTPAASWQTLDVAGTVNDDGSVSVVKTERIAITGRMPATLSWVEPIPEAATNLTFARQGQTIPVNPPSGTPAPYVLIPDSTKPDEKPITLVLPGLVPPVEQSLVIQYRLPGAVQDVDGARQVSLPVLIGAGLGPAWNVTTEIRLPGRIPTNQVTLSSEGATANTSYVNDQTGWFGATSLPTDGNFTAIVRWGGPPATPTLAASPVPSAAPAVAPPTETPTPTPTDTIVPATPTSTATPTNTSSPTTTSAKAVGAAVASATRLATRVPTRTTVPTKTKVPTSTSTAIPTQTPTKAPTSTSTPLPTATNTSIPQPPPPPAPTATNTAIPTATPTRTPTLTPTPTFTPSATATWTPTPTNTATPTNTPVPLVGSLSVSGPTPAPTSNVNSMQVAWTSSGGVAPYTSTLTGAYYTNFVTPTPSPTVITYSGLAATGGMNDTTTGCWSQIIYTWTVSDSSGQSLTKTATVNQFVCLGGAG